jgi:hypothetical protein
MILDALLLFTGGSGGIGNADGATDSPTTGTQASSNVIDLGMAAGIPTSANGGGARDIGVGDDPAMKLLVQVTLAFTGGTSMGIILQGAPDNGSGAPGTYTTMYTGPVILEAGLVAGARLADVDIPKAIWQQVLPRFLRVEFISAGTHGAGKVEATMVLDRNDHVLGSTGALSGYPAGINVLN